MISKVEPKNLNKGDWVKTLDGVYEVVDIDKEELHLELAEVLFVDDESDEYSLIKNYNWSFSEFRSTDFRRA